MTEPKFSSMSIDDLWHLREQISQVLADKIKSEKRTLESRLAKLNEGIANGKTTRSGLVAVKRRTRARRKYPKVVPKFQNPKLPTETWSGRGKQPRWLAAQIKAGRKIDDFRIAAARRQGS
jgi:DNA-binding protein H-NS